MNPPRHCEERGRDEAIHSFFSWRDGLLRFARNDDLGPAHNFLTPKHPKKKGPDNVEAPLTISCRAFSCRDE